MKKKLCLSLLTLSLFLGMVGCGHSLLEMRITNNQFDKAFDTAVETGISLGYTPTFEDKEKGEIVLARRRSTTKHKIIIDFYRSPDNNDVIVRFKKGLLESLASTTEQDSQHHGRSPEGSPRTRHGNKRKGQTTGAGISSDTEINIIASEIKDKLS